MNVDYYEGLCFFLWLLPLCHYVEMHDLLNLVVLNENRFVFRLDDDDASVISTRLVETFPDQGKQKHDFIRPTKTLYNFVLSACKGARTTKVSLTKTKYNFFYEVLTGKHVHGESSADVDTPTSWTILWQLNLDWSMGGNPWGLLKNLYYQY